MPDPHQKTRRAYRFLSEHNGRTITAAELARAADWSEGSARTYIAKNLSPWLSRTAPGHYLVVGMGTLPEEDFVLRQSQMKSRVVVLPTAADDEGTRALEQALRDGEGSETEFKQEFPKQATDLAHEIAALAVEGGEIWLGVADDHTLVGLKNMASQGQRNQFRERIEGVARSVRPSGVRVRVSWIEYGEAVICRVRVAQGSEPIYYCDSRPYVRDGSHSRPAEPHEVRARIEASLAAE